MPLKTCRELRVTDHCSDDNPNRGNGFLRQQRLFVERHYNCSLEWACSQRAPSLSRLWAEINIDGGIEQTCSYGLAGLDVFFSLENSAEWNTLDDSCCCLSAERRVLFYYRSSRGIDPGRHKTPINELTVCSHFRSSCPSAWCWQSAHQSSFINRRRPVRMLVDWSCFYGCFFSNCQHVSSR